MDSPRNSVFKVDNLNGYQYFNFEEQPPLGAWDLQVLPDSFNHCVSSTVLSWNQYQLPYNGGGISYMEYKDDFEDICGEIGWWDVNKPLFKEEDIIMAAERLNIFGQFDQYNENVHERNLCEVSHTAVRWREPAASVAQERQNGRYKPAELKLDEIQKYFDVPITKAAKELKVGLTVLKKRCRELNIMRWPHRKIKSLKSLIDNVKELGLTHEIDMLEEHKRILQKLPEMELTERTKKLRQACFKANYKKRRALVTAALL